jgi:hypothetical protein
VEKIDWQGRIVSVQPRIQLTRSFDERSHSYLGYSLILEGVIGGEQREFSVGIGKGAQSKHAFRVGDVVSGQGRAVADTRMQPVELYRASRLEVRRRGEADWEPPPWHGAPPDLETYQWRGHRRLSARTYTVKCRSCIWGCRMPVEMIIDPWNPRMEYRFETFCYGPLSCKSYSAGPRRVVPGRKGMRFVEPDWLDEEETAHRDMDQ